MDRVQLEQKPDILVATPGTILTFIDNNVSASCFFCRLIKLVDLQEDLQMLVLDEADLLLSFGYESDLTRLVSKLPHILQGMLMSATLSPVYRFFSC